MTTLPHPPAAPPTQDPSSLNITPTLTRATAALLSKRHPDGHWCAELQGDSILNSEYLLLKFILNQESDPDLPAIANYLRSLQQPDGGWNMYPGGANDISGTVKAYFALKLMGDSPDAPHMLAAKNICLQLGGAEACNSFTKFYFAALGQLSYDACPSIPPEIVLLPKFLYFNLYAVSAWSRTMILPLAIVSTLRPVRHVPEGRGMRELFLNFDTANSPKGSLKNLPKSWREMFLLFDLTLKRFQKTSVTPLRPLAMREAEKWILDHMQDSEGLGAIFPPMVYVLIVFRALGYPDTHPKVLEAQQHLKDLFVYNPNHPSYDPQQGPPGSAAKRPPHAQPTVLANEPSNGLATSRPPNTQPIDPPLVPSNGLATSPPTPPQQIRIQPCFSPVWDTGIALHALAETGLTEDSPIPASTVTWLLNKECRTSSDWAKNTPDVEPAGWFFEYANPHYPDVDDTAMVAMALKRTGGPRAAPAVKRALHWLLAMQNDDGGWSAFDRTRSKPILEHVPFADHNAIQDPSCPDITGRVLECLGHCGYTTTHPAVRKAIDFIKETQDKDGCWFGRWGVNYIYGTWQTLTGLKSVHERMDHKWIRKSIDWLRSVQKPDGSFGESADTYENPNLKGRGPSTPSQTAWGAMALMAAAGKSTPNDPHIKKAIQWLITHQLPDGNWEENWYTGTGFPKVFYLNYHLYRLYFPITALARYQRLSK